MATILPYRSAGGHAAAEGVDAINTVGVYPQVAPGSFACFRVVNFDISAGHMHFCAEFDFRRHPTGAEQARTEKSWPASFPMSIPSTFVRKLAAMASLRCGTSKDGISLKLIT